MGSLHYDKLVRDKIPEMIRQAGKQPVTDTLSHEAMADVLEVLHGIAYHKGISWDDVESARVCKRDECGGFEKGIRLLEVKEL